MDDLEKQLAQAGIDVHDVEHNGLLHISSLNKFFHEPGSFNPDDIAQKTADMTDMAVYRGFSGLRITADGDHLNNGTGNDENLIAYEESLNKRLFPYHQVIALCQYDLNQACFFHTQILQNGRQVSLCLR